ncbi:MAG: tetratricopeptide repeat protein [Rhizobacter sp.]|nr:tetratricopeptide repeat protein [Chlorobiales bacterium]
MKKQASYLTAGGIMLTALLTAAVLSGCGTPEERAKQKMDAAAAAIVKGQELFLQQQQADEAKAAKLGKEIDELKAKSLRLSEEAIKDDPGNLDAYGNYGYILQGMMDKASVEKAIAVYKQGLEKLYATKPPPYQRGVDDSLQNKYNTFNLQIGVSYQRLEKYDEAFTYLEKVREYFPGRYADANFKYGYYLQASGKIDSAIVYFERATELDPRKADNYPYLEAAYKAKAAEQKKTNPKAAADWGKITAAYKRAIAADPSNGDFYIRLASAYDAADMRKDAVQTYKEALEKNPNSYTAMNNYGMLLSDMNKNAEALPLLKKSVEINKNYATGYFNYGTVLSNMGKKSEAIEQFKLYIKMAGDDPQSAQNVAMLKREFGL